MLGRPYFAGQGNMSRFPSPPHPAVLLRRESLRLARRDESSPEILQVSKRRCKGPDETPLRFHVPTAGKLCPPTLRNKNSKIGFHEGRFSRIHALHSVPCNLSFGISLGILTREVRLQNVTVLILLPIMRIY